MQLHPTRFDGYYVTDDGEIWTEWYRNPTKRGVPRKMTQHERGGATKESKYLSINISLKDENGKTSKQINYYSHRLIAETLLSNPNNFDEIDHIDRNKQNNSVNNLRWASKFENMTSWKRDDEYRKKLSETIKMSYIKRNLIT